MPLDNATVSDDISQVTEFWKFAGQVANANSLSPEVKHLLQDKVD
jgi:hypothetical protein